MIYDIIFFPVILIIGAITSYQDCRTSKIKNKWIVLSMIYVISIYFLIWFMSSVCLDGQSAQYTKAFFYTLFWKFDKWCINAGVSAIVAFVIWRMRMWGAGDAKLFIAYAMLIPMGKYSRSYFDYNFSSFFLLLAAFVPPTIIIVSKALYLSFIKAKLKLKTIDIKKDCRNFLSKIIEKDKEKNEKSLKIILGFCAVFLFFRLFQHIFLNLSRKYIADQNIIVILSLFAFKPLSKFFVTKGRKIMVTSFLFLVILYVIQKQDYFPLNLLVDLGRIFSKTLSIMIIYPLLRKLLDFYTEKDKKEHIPFARWMFLGVLIIWIF